MVTALILQFCQTSVGPGQGKFAFQGWGSFSAHIQESSEMFIYTIYTYGIYTEDSEEKKGKIFKELPSSQKKP